MKVSIAVERLQYGYVTVDVDSLDEAKEIQDFNGYDVTSQTTEDWHVPDTLLNKDGWYEVEEGEEAKLKSCPFCGGTNICTEKGINLNYCDNCSAESNIEHWNTRPIEDALNKRIAELTECVGSKMADVYTLKARIAELSQAVGLITTLKPTMVMDTEHPLDMAKEVEAYVAARIAELEARLESCESALVSMTYQFFYSSESGALAHSFMSAEEEAAEYLVDYGIARWENEHKNSIVFEEVQE